MKNKILILTVLLTVMLNAQDDKSSPYYEIPEYSETYTAGTVAARQVDALGFRFYWASKGLTEKDLSYKPSETVRTAEETIDHIYDLALIVLNSTIKQPNSKKEVKLTYEEKRKQALLNLKQAADILRKSDDISQYKIIFAKKEVPFWNTINGPIADAIWHCGQLASFRRVTGNPINSKVNHFTGKVKD